MTQHKKKSRLVRWGRNALLALIVLFLALKIVTDMLVNRAELKYPPDETVLVEGLKLNYVRAGNGRPVVFIPGGSGLLQNFTLSPMFDAITADYQTIFFDRPGLGYSEKPYDETATPAVQARLLHGALQELGVDKPVLVGQSWGGVIALTYALDYPDDLAGIVLLGSSPYPRERHEDYFDVIARMPVVGDLTLNTVYVPVGRYIVAPAILEQRVDNFAPLTAVPPTFEDLTLTIGLRSSHLKASAIENAVIPPALEGLSQRLGEVAAPVTIVAGTLDTHAFEQASRLDEAIPHSEVVIVAEANHYLWYAYPDVVVTAVTDTWAWADSLGVTAVNP